MPDAWGLKDVSVAFGARTVLRDVNLRVSPGQIVAVVGGDGSGKSTLLRTLIGRVRPGAGDVFAPAITDIGYQSANSGTWGQLTVAENLDLVARAYKVPDAEYQDRVSHLLAAADLAEARTRLAAHLSGGMRQKLGFCMAMVHAPSLLVLDEPSTGVDPVSRVELWALISEAAAAGAAVVLTTTYLDEAERVHDVLVLDEGTTLLHGTPERVIEAAPGTVVALPYPTEPLLAWRRGRRWRQWHAGPPQQGEQVVMPDMEDAVVSAAFEARDAATLPPVALAPRHGFPAAGTELARVSNVTKQYGDLNVVDDVTMTVRAGEIVGIIGANGAGKTTLIRMQLGLLLPSYGEVALFGQAPTRETRRRVGYVPQGLGLYRDLTVAENLTFVADAYGRETLIDEGLRPVADELVNEVGLGRQRQLAFSCALSHEPTLLVLDEPTSGVDPISRARLWDTIHAQAEAGAGVMVSTHYMQEAEQCDRLVLLDLGRVVAHGTVTDIIGSTTAVSVQSDDWSQAFMTLSAEGLPVALSGTEVRVADTDPGVVSEALGGAGLGAHLEVVPATLEEAMTAITRNRAVA